MIRAMGPKEPGLKACSPSRPLGHKLQRSAESRWLPSLTLQATTRPPPDQTKGKKNRDRSGDSFSRTKGKCIQALKCADPLTQQQPVGKQGCASRREFITKLFKIHFCLKEKSLNVKQQRLNGKHHSPHLIDCVKIKWIRR